MTIKFSQLATSTLLAFSSVIALEGLSSVQLFNPLHLGQSNVAIAQDAEEGVNVRVYRAASPAVVSITTESGTGSGSIISADGLVLTNAHVVNNVRQITVVLSDRRRFEADVVGFGEGGLDLAALRIRGQRNLPTLEIAPPNSVEVGQRAFAIGNPFGQFQGTFTTGIVSRVDTNRGLIQTDAAINPGNSGGPLLNSRGQMIGVNSAIYTPRGSSGNTGIGFAIAIDRVQPFLVAVQEGRAPRTPDQSPMLGGGPPAQRITLNGSVLEGTLNDRSGILQSDNSYYNPYTFEGRAGQQVSIEMTSRELNAYLILLGPDGTDLAQDNDSAGNQNARIVLTLPQTGMYTVYANTFQPGESGRYNLRVAAGASSTPSPNPTRLILREQGELGAGSQVWREDGSLYQEYSFEGTSGQTVTITLESDEFDTYLMLFDQTGQVIAQNDDISPNSTNSSITISLPQTGMYRVIANAYDRSGRGRFVLTVR